jgi:hypothetical protein
MSTTERKPNSVERLDQLVTEACDKMEMNSWNSFVRELPVPSGLLPALMSGRTQLVEPSTPKTLSAEEIAAIYKLIAGLIDTNQALRRHAEEVSRQIAIWTDAFKHLQSVGYRIEHFANFRSSDAEDES